VPVSFTVTALDQFDNTVTNRRCCRRMRR
jgi:hypothetical protein